MSGLVGVDISGTWLTALGALALASLIPVVWAIVDVVRRPTWQFSAGRKVMWAFTLGFGWLLLWPLALVSSVLYLVVLRRRFPPAEPGTVGGSGHWQPHLYQQPPYPQPPYPQPPYPGGAYRPGQPYPGQPYPGQPLPGQPYPGQPYPGQAPPHQPARQGAPTPSAYHKPAPPHPRDLPPAGWYPDPAGSPSKRWWDGVGWSELLR